MFKIIPILLMLIFSSIPVDAVKTQPSFIIKNSQVGQLYNAKEIVKMSSTGIYACLENYTTSFQQGMPTVGTYFVIVDLSLLNTSGTNYYSSLANFTLKDALGYSYSTYLAYPYQRGDLTGFIKPAEMTRGQLVFKVPGDQSQFKLYIKNSKIKTTGFKITIKRW
jgi:hypothetical protein